jgi:hypothetical protein
VGLASTGGYEDDLFAGVRTADEATGTA